MYSNNIKKMYLFIKWKIFLTSSIALEMKISLTVPLFLRYQKL